MAEPFIGADEFERLPDAGTLDPARIRFSQRSVSPAFKDARFGAVHDLARRLKNGEVVPTAMEPIRIVLKNGKVFSLDNRRLKAFQDAGIDVPYMKLEAIPQSQQFKFTTKNEGVSISLRGQ